MTVGTRTVRLVLVGIAVLLVAVLLGFISLARLRAHRYLLGLPGKLGIDIKQETNGFTYSQSSKGHTVFTVHASKEVQRNDGTITLHDVGIVLFGPNGERTDQIHGTNFEYDAKAHLLQAAGEVFIDLLPPGSNPNSGDDSSRMVHVRTNGLLFDEQARSATTEGALEFRTTGYSGDAVGASYDSSTGILLLRSKVQVSGLRDGRPATLTAARAEINRTAQTVDLQNAHYAASDVSGEQTLAADYALIHLTHSGSPTSVDALGNVTLSGSEQGTISAARLEVQLGETSQPRSAHLVGDVRYARDAGAKRDRGRSNDVRITFDNAGHPTHVSLAGDVTSSEEAAGSLRALDASSLELVLAGGGRTPTLISSALAAGNQARLRMTTADAKGGEATDLRAARLNASFAGIHGKSELTRLDGTGETLLERVGTDAHGALLRRESSRGDTLHVDFATGSQGRSTLRRAEQHGAITSLREVRNGRGELETEHAKAGSASYDAEVDSLRLNGAVKIDNAQSMLLADEVVADRANGDVHARGSVRVTYVSEGQAEPLHVTAARAEAHKASGIAEFFGVSGVKPRMWQGSSQVEAPLLRFDRTQGRLSAEGDRGDEPPQVSAFLSGSAAKEKRAGPLHITSRDMTYTEDARRIDFHGDVRAAEADRVMTSADATVWLSAGEDAGAARKEATDLMIGRVDRMLATGGVSLVQPGREAAGERLLYTASDGTFVLTGTSSAPPRVVDEARGTITGAVLRFKTGDRNVSVAGTQAAGNVPALPGKVRSEVRMRPR